MSGHRDKKGQLLLKRAIDVGLSLIGLTVLGFPFLDYRPGDQARFQGAGLLPPGAGR